MNLEGNIIEWAMESLLLLFTLLDTFRAKNVLVLFWPADGLLRGISEEKMDLYTYIRTYVRMYVCIYIFPAELYPEQLYFLIGYY